MKIKCTKEEICYQKLLLSSGVFYPVNSEEVIRWLHDCAEKKLTPTTDSYIYSPVYYFFTGRRGLFVYDCSGTKTFICWHPNVFNTLLIFPPLSKNDHTPDIEVLTQLIRQLPQKEKIEIHLCRVDEELQKKLQFHEQIFIPHHETVLDWIYPVHLLDTTLVKGLQGKHFQQVRQRINQLDITPFHLESLDIKKHYDEILNLIKIWGEYHTDTNYSIEDLVYPTQTLLDLFFLKNTNLEGQLIYHHDQLKSFAIWDKIGIFSNEFAIASDKEIEGLSEYQMYNMCIQLEQEGIKKVNIGGSETNGLDRFKKKFHPAYSYNLNTFLVYLPKTK